MPSFLVSTAADLAAALAAFDSAPVSNTSYSITFGANITLDRDLPAIMGVGLKTLVIDGAGFTLDGGGAHRGFFAESGSIAIANLTIANAASIGGAGDGDGGGGAGLGGGLFVAAATAVSLQSVLFVNDSAIGGAGGSDSTRAGSGGSLGGAPVGQGFDGGSADFQGNPGGFGGGGGGGQIFPGGAGGFGGGGGGGARLTAQGGFGGGTSVSNSGFGGGGGGLGAGGAVFVQTGGFLSIQGAGTESGGSVAPGAGGLGAGIGLAAGAGFFFQGGGTLSLVPGAGQTITLADAIADQAGAGGSGTEAVSVAAGRVKLSSPSSTFTGGVAIGEGGTLELAADGAAGTGAVTFKGGRLLQIDASSRTSETAIRNTIYGIVPGDTIDLRDIVANQAVVQAGNGLFVKQAGRDLIALELDLNQDFTNIAFTASPDGAGGTNLVAVDPYRDLPISGLVTTPNTGTAGLGTQIGFALTPSRAVAVGAGGVPTLALSNGATASYTGQDTTGALLFSTTVAAGQATPDLVVTGFAANGAALTQPGTLAVGFGSSALSSNASTSTSIAAGDLNGDGKPDVVFASGGAAYEMLGDGAGGFGAQTQIASGAVRSVALADVNGDGKLDLVVADQTFQNTGVRVLLGNGAGGFAAPVTVGGSLSPATVVTADLNADAKPDIVAIDSSGSSLSVLLNDGAGGFSVASTMTGLNSATSVAVADVNGDGNSDLIVSNETGSGLSVLLGNGHGSFAAPTTIAATTPSYVVAADLNGDGIADLAYGSFNNNTVTVLLGTGTGTGIGTFNAAGTYPLSGTPLSIKAVDLNGDGKLDLAVGLNNGGISVLQATGGGKFRPAVNFATQGSSVLAVTAADLNGDGKPDLLGAVNRIESGGVATLLNAAAPAAATLDLATTTGLDTGLAVGGASGPAAASASFEKVSGAGSFSQAGLVATLDLGSVIQGSGAVTVALGVLNSAAAPADFLSGSFTTAGDGAISVTGLDAFADVGAGQADLAPMVSLATSNVGSFTRTITLAPTDLTGGEGGIALPPQTLIVTGTVTPLPVIALPASATFEKVSGPGAFSQTGTLATLNLGTFTQGAQGSGAQIVGLGVLNGATAGGDALAGSFTTSGSGALAVTGLAPFSAVTPGQADLAPTLTFDTSTPGTFTRTIVLAPTDLTGAEGGVVLPAQTLTVTGTVTASGTVTPPIIVGGLLPFAGLGVNSTDPNGAPTVIATLAPGVPGIYSNLAGGTLDASGAVYSTAQTAPASTGALRTVTFGTTQNGFPLLGVAATINGAAGSGSTLFDAGAGLDSITAGTGDDTLLVSPDRATLQGGVGHDLLYALGANDLLLAGTGVSTLVGGRSGTTMRLGDGNQLAFDGGGTASIFGGTGNDTVVGLSGNDTVVLGSGNNLVGFAQGRNVVLSAGTDTLIAGAGSDTISAFGRPLVFGGAGSLTFGNAAGIATVIGESGAGSLTVNGGQGGGLFGGGRGGGNFLTAGQLASTLYGAAGGDTLVATGSAADVLVAGDGNETLNGTGSSGFDLYFGGGGADSIGMGAGGGVVVLGGGNATIVASAAADVIAAVNGIAGGAATVGGFAVGTDHVSAQKYTGAALQGFADAPSFAAAHATVANGAISFVLPDNTRITLAGVTSLAGVFA